MKVLKQLSLALLCVFFILNLSVNAENIPKSKPGSTPYTEALVYIQKSSKALKKNNLKPSLRLAKKALKIAPANPTIVGDAWKVFMLAGKYEEANKMNEILLGHLRKLKKSDEVVRAMNLAKWRSEISSIYWILSEKVKVGDEYKNIDVRQLRTLIKENSVDCFLTLKEVMETYNIWAACEIYKIARSGEVDDDFNHTHVNLSQLRDSYDFLVVADSINSIFEHGNGSIHQNMKLIEDLTIKGYKEELFARDQIYIKSLSESSCTIDLQEDRIKPDTIRHDFLEDLSFDLNTYLKGDIGCVQDISNELLEYDEFHFLLDHSGSMEEKTNPGGNSQSRVVVAQQSAVQIMSDLLDAGLNSIHSISVGNDCGIPESLNTYRDIPEAEKNEERVLQTLEWIHTWTPEGVTPLYISLQQLEQHIEPSKKKKAVVLFTDGIDYCEEGVYGESENNKAIREIIQNLEKLNCEIFVITFVPDNWKFKENYAVYRTLTANSNQLWTLGKECKKAESHFFDIKLEITIPELYECASHSRRQDNLQFPWIDIYKNLKVSYIDPDTP